MVCVTNNSVALHFGQDIPGGTLQAHGAQAHQPRLPAALLPAAVPVDDSRM
jgi:hypothetical protein